MLHSVTDERLLHFLLDSIRPLTKGSELTHASKAAWLNNLQSALFHGQKGVLNLLLDKGPNVKDYLTADALLKAFTLIWNSDQCEVGCRLLARLVELRLPQASDHCLCKLMAKTINISCEEETAMEVLEALISLTDLTCPLTDASKAAWLNNLQSALFHGQKGVLNLLLDKGPNVKDYLTADALLKAFTLIWNSDQCEVGCRLLARLVELRLPQASDHCLCKLMAKTINTCCEEETAMEVLEALINLTDLTCPLTDASKAAWLNNLQSALFHGQKGVLNLLLDKGPNVKDYLTADALLKAFTLIWNSDQCEVGCRLLARLVELRLPQASDHCLCKLMAKTINISCEEETAMEVLEALISLTDLTWSLTDASKAAWLNNLQSALFHGQKGVLNLLLDKGPNVKDYLTADALLKAFALTENSDQWEVGCRLLARLVELRLPQASDHCLCKLMAKTINTCCEEETAMEVLEALINLTDLTCPWTEDSKAAWLNNLQSAVFQGQTRLRNLLLDKGPNVKDYLTADVFWAVLEKDKLDKQWDRLRLHFCQFHRTSSPDDLWNVQDVKKLQKLANTCWEEQRKQCKRDELSPQLQNALCAFKALKPVSSIERKFVDVQEKTHELLVFCWRTLASDKISQQRRERRDFKLKNYLKSQVKIHLAVFFDSIFHLDGQVQQSRFRTNKDIDKAATAAHQTDRFAEKLVEKIVHSM